MRNGLDWDGRSERKLLCCWMWKLIYFSTFCLLFLLLLLLSQVQASKSAWAKLQGDDYGTVPLRHQLGWTLLRGTLLAGVHGQDKWVLNADVYGPISSKETIRCELIHKMEITTTFKSTAFPLLESFSLLNQSPAGRIVISERWKRCRCFWFQKPKTNYCGKIKLILCQSTLKLQKQSPGQ